MKVELACILVLGITAACGRSTQKFKIRLQVLNVTFNGEFRPLRKFLRVVNRFEVELLKYPRDRYDNALVLLLDNAKRVKKKLRKLQINFVKEKDENAKMIKSFNDELTRLLGRGNNPKFNINDANTFEAMVSTLQEWYDKCPAQLKCRKLNLGNGKMTHEKQPIIMFSVGLRKGVTPTTTPDMAPSPTPTPSPVPTPVPFTTPELTTTNMPSKKKGIWIDCLIHGREWVAGTTCMLFIQKLLTEYNTDEVKLLLEKYDWHFVPIMNPDGYRYTWAAALLKAGTIKNNQYVWRRIYRKNRFPECPVKTKTGVDLNRNYNDNFWRVGASKEYKQECDFQLYAGKVAASEQETQIIQDQLSKEFQWLLCSTKKILAKDHLDLFLTIHSNAKGWVYPTGRKKQKDCVKVDKVVNDRLKAMTDKAKAKSPDVWQTGTICDIFGHNPGNLLDYANGVAGIENALALELGGVGFTIGDVKLIQEQFDIAWKGVVAMLGHLS